MPEFDLCFSASATDDTGSFKLLELPSELAQLIEESTKLNAEPLVFTIKGQANEEAVLCTNSKTYALRSVALSNSVLVVTSPPGEFPFNAATGRESVVIRDELHEILELLPAVPRLYKLIGLLRGREYDESDEGNSSNEKVRRNTHILSKKIRSDPKSGVTQQQASYYSYEEAKSEIQTSDEELDRGLKERRILVINGALRPISKDYLQSLLEIILNLLVSLALPHDDVPLDDLISTLAEDHEVSTAVSTQLMAWFGDVSESGGKWKMDVGAVLKEVGIGLLRRHRRDPISKEVFIAKWKAAVGDTFESSVDLSLLSGNYLVSATDGKVHLTYFPSAELPTDPAQRFADIFRTKARWKGDEIAPFLGEIAVNSKERDKLLLKYCRANTDTSGVWYTARTQYHG